MTDQNHEDNQARPFDITDPSERVREIVSGSADDTGHDPGDESDHEIKKTETPVDEAPASPEPKAEEKPAINMKSMTDYLDEDLAGVVSNLVKEIDRLKSETHKVSQSAKVDELVSSLSDEWQPVFRDKANRAKLDTAIQVMKTGYQQSGITAPSDSDIVQKALRAEFGEVKQSIEQENTEAKVAERKSQMIARASGRRSDSLSPKESALKSVHKIMVERGLYNS